MIGAFFPPASFVLQFKGEFVLKLNLGSVHKRQKMDAVIPIRNKDLFLCATHKTDIDWALRWGWKMTRRESKRSRHDCQCMSLPYTLIK